MRSPRLMVIGLDCASPRLVFERYRKRMPHVAALMSRGVWGPLWSTVPPITVPAWACMTSGRDPGELGIYGFRDRNPHTYGMRLVDSRHVHVPRAWDYLGDVGKKVGVLFVPPSYPPSPVVNGALLSCFLTPDATFDYATSASLKKELEARFGAYIPDVDDYRSKSKAELLDNLYAMTAQHFAMARHLWTTERPDFLMMVEIGLDRLHHAFWNDIDPSHPEHDPQSDFRDVGENYYEQLDRHIGSMLSVADEQTTVMVVSDHGARSLLGGSCINEWLVREGWLVLKTPPSRPTPLTPDLVDWSRTRAWGEGGYYGRVFMNVKGREPSGIVEPSEYDAMRRMLAETLERIPVPDGTPPTHVRTPESMYRKTNGTPPDLFVFFGDLGLRSIGSVGLNTFFTVSNDTGRDTCNHDWEGIFVMAGPGVAAQGRVDDLQIYDVFPTILHTFGVSAPPDTLGSVIGARS